jgi:hypothetical protein
MTDRPVASGAVDENDRDGCSVSRSWRSTDVVQTLTGWALDVVAATATEHPQIGSSKNHAIFMARLIAAVCLALRPARNPRESADRHHFAVRERVGRSYIDHSFDVVPGHDEFNRSAEIQFVNPGDVLLPVGHLAS